MFSLAQQPFCDHRALHANRLPPRAHFLPFEDEPAALSGTSGRVDNLSGDWAFRFFRYALDVTREVIVEEPCAENGYHPIRVPRSWQFAGCGEFLYTDEAYPFTLDPPFVPAENPTGVYKRCFVWDGGLSLTLRLEGVESFCSVYVNGSPVGFTKGSRLPAEFDLAPFLREGRNALCLVVHQYCDGSYLEDQDQWWLGGIIRDVLLISRPADRLENVILDADYDAGTGTGSLRIRASLIGQGSLIYRLLDASGTTALEGSAGADTALSLPGAVPWNAELPNLYTLLLSVLSGGSVQECVRQEIGFRRVEIRDGELLLNGRRIMMRGVNRHEFSPVDGRAVSYESTKADLEMMKRHHINAVRTAHYPDNPFFYDLCDRLGLYVIDECDLETHGFQIEKIPRRLAEDPEWRPAYLDRAQRTVHRDRNHACVVMWSLGNESFYGGNFHAMYDWIHREDPARPVHYEGEPDDRGRMDVTSSMYSPVGLLRELDAMQAGKPHILCEFGHAMGNGPGSLMEYTDMMEDSRRIQGYFVWEWRDHGVRAQGADGKVTYRYGGEFGEKDTSGNFCMDGLLLSDSTPTPGFFAYAKAIEPLHVTRFGEDAWAIRNRFDFRDTASCRGEWVLRRNGDPVLERHQPLPVIAPRSVGAVPLPPDIRDFRTDNAHWTLSLTCFDGESVLGRAHHVLRAYRPVRMSLPPRPSCTETGAGYLVRGERFSFTLSKSDGRLRDYAFDGKTVMTEGPVLDFFRAYTDNDRNLRDEWQRLSVHNMRMTVKAITVEKGPQSLVLRVEGLYGAIARNWGAPVTLTYEAFGDGRVHVDVKGAFTGDFGTHPSQELPRIGTTSHVPGTLSQAAYLAYGPGESYCDSLQQADLDIYSTPVEAMNFPYERPQEHGNRTGCGFLTLSDGEGAGILFASLAPRDMSVKPWEDYDLFKASHAADLVKRDRLTVHFDLINAGLGSASCGPGRLRQYAAKAVPFRFSFAIAPFTGGEAVDSGFRALDFLGTITGEGDET